MKNILVVAVLLASANAAAEVYYCGHEDKTGFRFEDEKYLRSNFYEEKFKISVNLENKMITVKG